jgi:hypothetical protein
LYETATGKKMGRREKAVFHHRDNSSRKTGEGSSLAKRFFWNEGSEESKKYYWTTRAIGRGLQRWI